MRILCSILPRQVQVQLVARDWPMRISRDDHGPVQPYFVEERILYLSHSTSPPRQSNTGDGGAAGVAPVIGRHSSRQVEQWQPQLWPA